MKRKHKKILKLAKGYRGRAKNCFKLSIDKVCKSLLYAYRDRRNRKRDFRSLWIQRINSAARSCGISYSSFMRGTKLINLDLNRKMLSELAVNDPESFKEIVNRVNKTLKSS